MAAIKHFLRRIGAASYLLPGRSVFDAPYYAESQAARLLNLFAHVDLKHWQGLRVLEVGAGNGEIGNVFRSLGFDVVSTDGRETHVRLMRARGIDAQLLDLDHTEIDEFGKYDIILAFGVLYHLSEPERFLLGCGRAANILLLESAVSDSPEPVLRPVREPTGLRGQDQALHVQGCRPSPAWVENTCRAAGFETTDISNPVANWKLGCFDWHPNGDGSWQKDGVNFRKMWVCEKASSQA